MCSYIQRTGNRH